MTVSLTSCINLFIMAQYPLICSLTVPPKQATSAQVSIRLAFHYLSLQCTYINGSPQNTFVPGLIQLAEERKVFLGGDDFKSGQTKVKSVLIDFLVSAGIKVGRANYLQ